MPDDLAQAVQSWMRRMERSLRGLQDAGDTEELRDTLDALSKQVRAWQILYEPPMDVPMSPPVSSRGFHSRTIGGNN